MDKELIEIMDIIANIEEDGKNKDPFLNYSNDSVWIALRKSLNEEIELRKNKTTKEQE